MKFAILKSTLSVALAVLATSVVTPNAQAEAYLSKATEKGYLVGERVYFRGELKTPPASFKNVEGSAGNVLFMDYYSQSDSSYVGMLGDVKRTYVFKLQKRQDNGTKADLILPSIQEAKDYCFRLIRGAHDLPGDGPVIGQYIFASVSAFGLGLPRMAIAVGYRVPYEGSYKEPLTLAKKYLMCPNPFNIGEDPSYEDEDQFAGVRASGLSDTDYFNPDADITGRYHVACMDSKMPETDFVRFHNNWFEEPGNHYFKPEKYSDQLEELDATLGREYCAGRLKENPVSPRPIRG